ncbi:hypothetical protein RQP46_011255 [Phenoliferia psychrophenolica]
MSHSMIWNHDGRWQIRNTIGLYSDFLSIYAGGDSTVELQKQRLGPLLYDMDSTVAAKLCTPPLIPRHQFSTLFSTSNPPISLESGIDSFHALIERISTKPVLTSADADQAQTAARGWISVCQRAFSDILFSSAGGDQSLIAAVRQLWSLIDQVHGSIQKFQRVLIRHEATSIITEDSIKNPNQLALVGAHLDTRLLHLCSMLHGTFPTYATTNPELEDLRLESKLRVRKCLKLFSCYAQLYTASDEQHATHHLVMHLELLRPSWVQLATQRYGDVPGPSRPEYEVTEEELDWLTAALRVACFYSPMPAQRLAEMELLRGLTASLHPTTSDTAAPPLIPLPDLASYTSPGVYPDITNGFEPTKGTSNEPSGQDWTAGTFEELRPEPFDLDATMGADFDIDEWLGR